MDSVGQFLEQANFRDPARAKQDLEAVSRRLPPGRLHLLKLLLPQVPDPDTALRFFERYISEAAHTVEWICSPSSRLHAALAIFSYSRFLAETIIHHPQLLEWALDEERLYRVVSAEEMRSELGWISASSEEADVARTLARFKRMHTLRIAIRDVLGLATLAEATLELSNLADALLQGAQEQVQQRLQARFGRPLCMADTGPIESHFVVLALGKLGGQELNYSSDIDLMFLYTDEGETAGPIRISNREFSTQLAQRLTRLLSQITPEGWCYRVDLRLRPEGNAGEIVTTLRSAVEYYHRRARDWELQMLIKARPAAGSPRLGRMFLGIIEPLIYQTTTDFSLIERVAETRDRIQQNLHRRAKLGLDLKLSRGGIRDIEFLVQCMQRLHGGRDTWVRSGGTLFALHRLRDKGYLSMPDYARLSSAYQYLRTLEHRLQLERNDQTHTLPDSPEALDLLARKMHDSLPPSRGRPHGLMRQVQSHLKRVSEIYERVVHAQRPLRRDEREVPAESPPAAPESGPEPSPSPSPSWQALLRHVGRESPRFAAAVKALPIRWGRKNFEHFLNKIVSLPDLLAEFENSPALLECVADLCENSPFLAEHLIRRPEDIRILKPLVEASGRPLERGSDSSPSDRRGPRPENHPEVDKLIEAEGGLESKSNWLRRFYRHQMLEILAESACCRRPIFSTLDKTSRLAEWVLRAAYEIACEDVCRTSGWKRPGPRLHVIALGRLGMREFDLGSDADLVFVIPDDEIPNRRQWTQVVERLIEIASSYTREGRIFSIDMRLRPMGRDGELVQSESHYLNYFAERAEAWEAITYMKARTVAGDFARGAGFLSRLQEVGWRRYGMSGNLARLLIAMREKLEREQGPAQPIKAGMGGYYDIDFSLMYLRLRDAGAFFESLNTPERIEVIRKAGGLTPSQAAEMHDTAVFFRSLDHALRVVTGHSSAKMPTARAQRQMVSELLGRWSRLRPGDENLASFVQKVRERTRALFEEIFQAGSEESRAAGAVTEEPEQP